jgi:hypothetical protein
MTDVLAFLATKKKPQKEPRGGKKKVLSERKKIERQKIKSNQNLAWVGKLRENY